MFYSLLYKSTITYENKLFLTFIYGSILYMVIHALLNFSNKELLIKIKETYFTYIFIIDIISLLYYINNDIHPNDDDKENNLNVKIDLIKNKIYEMFPKNNKYNKISFSHQDNTNNDTNNNANLDTTETNNLSTPVNNLSTPVNNLSTPVNNLNNNNFNKKIGNDIKNSDAMSVCESEAESALDMDLDDFSTSL